MSVYFSCNNRPMLWIFFVKKSTTVAVFNVTASTRGLLFMEYLHVVAMITNPVPFKSRVKLYQDFARYMAQFPNVILWTCEGRYPGRDWEVTDANNPYHLQIDLEHEIWHKENLINLVVDQRLSQHPQHKDWKYVAWIDADVHFARPDWAQATIDALHHHPVVQMFSECIDLDSRYNVVKEGIDSGIKPSMIKRWHLKGCKPRHPYTNRDGHCGYAWAMRRDAWDTLGGLLDFSIVGSADYQMACAFMGNIIDAIHYKPPANYAAALREWGDRAKLLDGTAGWVDGVLYHQWHGHKSSRGYNWRTGIIIKHQYDPARDLIRQANGAWRWYKENPQHAQALEEELKAYFRSRNEDVHSDEPAT